MDWMKYRKIYFAFSGVLLALCFYGIATYGLKMGVDFKGGSLIEYKFEGEIVEEDIVTGLNESGFRVSAIQKTPEETYIIRFSEVEPADKEELNIILDGLVGSNFEELRFESVGPSVGPDLVKKTIYAVVLAASAILLWIAIQFKDLRFGTCAVLATLHDSFVLIGSFSFLGHFFGAEVDFLIITAILTTLSFSVHDTIVVYDRIRETKADHGGNIEDVANKSITETMVRSLNNSFTLIFMLVAIILLGGTTLKWFATALLIGTITGTYSSPFVAVPLIVYWEKIRERIKRK